MFKYIISLCAALVVVGCASSIPSKSETAAKANFDQIQTFAFVSNGALISSNPEFPRLNASALDQSIRSAIINELTAKGLTATSASQADMLIGYGVSGQPQTDAWYDIYVGPRGGVRGVTTYERDYVKGTLIIDAFETSSRKLLWRGWASKNLYRPLGDDRGRIVGDAVSSILADFPPR